MLIQGCKREQTTTDGGTPQPAPELAAPTNPVSAEVSSNPVPVGTAPVPMGVPTPGPAPMATPTPVTMPPVPAATAAAPAPEAASAGTYEVAAGDTLAKIAKKNGVTLKALEAANPGVDSKKLKVKQKLNIPGKSAESSTAPASPAAAGAAAAPEAGAVAGGETYTVKSGDNLTKIAKHYGITIKALKTANPKLNTNHIKVGDKLNIPAKGEAAAPATAAPETPAAPVVPPAAPAPTPVTPAPAH